MMIASSSQPRGQYVGTENSLVHETVESSPEEQQSRSTQKKITNETNSNHDIPCGNEKYWILRPFDIDMKGFEKWIDMLTSSAFSNRNKGEDGFASLLFKPLTDCLPDYHTTVYPFLFSGCYLTSSYFWAIASHFLCFLTCNLPRSGASHGWQSLFEKHHSTPRWRKELIGIASKTYGVERIRSDSRDRVTCNLIGK